MLTPIIHKLEQDLNYIKFITIDVDANSDLAQRFNVSSIPTLFIYHNAKLAGKKTGYQGYEELAS
jgi:thioredoxin 1